MKKTIAYYDNNPATKTVKTPIFEEAKPKSSVMSPVKDGSIIPSTDVNGTPAANESDDNFLDEDEEVKTG